MNENEELKSRLEQQRARERQIQLEEQRRIREEDSRQKNRIEEAEKGGPLDTRVDDDD